MQDVESGKRGYWRLLDVTGGVLVSLRGYRRVQEVTGGYKGLQEVPGGYKRLPKVTRDYKGLQGVTRAYRRGVASEKNMVHRTVSSF